MTIRLRNSGMLVIITVLLCAAVCIGAVSADPIVISNEEQLKAFLNGSTSTGLTNSSDISLDSNTYDLGSFDAGKLNYSGTFDGNNAIITNWTSSTGGLFNNISLGGTLKNLQITSANITKDSGKVGAVANEVKKKSEKNTVTLTNIRLSGSNVSSPTDMVGGLIGEAESDTHIFIANCHVDDCKIIGNGNIVGGFGGSIGNFTIIDSTLQHTDVTADEGCVGGLIAKGICEYPSIQNCTVLNSNIIAKSTYMESNACVGGLIGKIQPATLSLSTCVVKNTNVKALGSDGLQIGGLVGLVTDHSTYNGNISVSDCRVEDCENISGIGNVGGLIGATGAVNGLGSTGLTNVVDSSVLHCNIFSTGSSQNINSYCIGGIIGNARTLEITDSTVSRCNITSFKGYLGGIVGVTSETTLTRCIVNESSKISTRMEEENDDNMGVGGLIGIVRPTCTASLSSSNVLYTVVNAPYSFTVGGLVGYMGKGGSIQQCSVSHSEMLSSGDLLGGVFGNSSGRVEITSCRVLSCNITGTNSISELLIGGISGVEEIIPGELKNLSLQNVVIRVTGGDAKEAFLFDKLTYPINSTNGIANLTLINLTNGNKIYNSYILNNSGVENSALDGFKNIKSNFTIDVSNPKVTSIAASAFDESGLTNLTNISSVKTIGAKAFNGSKLTGGFYIPGNVTVDDTAFDATDELEILYGNITRSTKNEATTAVVNITGNGILTNSSYLPGTITVKAGRAFETVKLGSRFANAFWNLSSGEAIPATASWVPGNTYLADYLVTNITLNATGGTCPTAAVNITYGNATLNTTIAMPTKTGHTFKGWYNETAGGREIINTTGKVISNVPGYTDNNGNWTNSSSDIILYANWTANVTTITLDKNGGLDTKTTNATYGNATLTGFENTTRTGYVLSGYRADPTSGNNIISADGKLQNGDGTYTNESGYWNYTSSSAKFYANWTAIVTTVTFHNETKSHSATYTYDQTATAKRDSKTGHTFTGWYDGAGIQVFDKTGGLKTSAPGYVNATDKWGYTGATLSLWANYTKNTYNVTFNPMNGTAAWNETVEYNSTVEKPTPDPTKKGHTFNGWNKTDGNKFDFETKITENTTLLANYTINTYNVTFNPMNGTAAWNETVEYNSTVEKPTPDPTKKGHTFNGWNTTTGTQFDFKTNITENTTLLANYTKNTYNVTFNPMNGTAAWNETVEYNSTVEKPTPDPTKKGHTFNGWNTTSGTKFDFKTNITENTTLLANYTINTYNVTFDPMNGTATWNETVEYNSTVEKPSPDPTKKGHTFNGWNTTTGTKFDFKTNITENTTLIANYTKNQTTVTYHNVSASDKINVTYVFNDTVTVPMPTRKGHVFNGWNLTSAAGSPFYPNAAYFNNGKWVFTGNNGTTLDVYGNWTANVTTVTFWNESEMMTPADYTFDADAKDADKANKTGHTFIGWFDADKVQVFNETGGLNASATAYANGTRWNYDQTKLTLWANFTGNTYTITNTSSDPVKGYTAVNKTDGAKFNEDVKAEAFPVSGNHFVNWTCVNLSSPVTTNPYIFTMPAKNVELTANFAGNITKVTYQNETGITYDTKTYVFNETAATPSDPEKEGYTFNGWNITVGGQEYPFDTNETYFKDNKWVFLGANNSALTVNASWTANTYTITNTSSDPVKGYTAINKTDGAKFNEDVKAEAFPVSGNHFVNWTCVNLSSPVTSNPYIFTMPAKNVSLTANFAGNVTKLHLVNSSSAEDVFATYRSNVLTPEFDIPESGEGHIFNGWNLSDGTILINATGKLVAGINGYTNQSGYWNNTALANGTTLTLAENWTVNTYNITYIQPTGGSVEGAENAAYGSTVEVTVTTDSGYTFKELDVTRNGTGTPVELSGTYTFTMPAFDVDVTAVFEKKNTPDTPSSRKDTESTIILKNDTVIETPTPTQIPTNNPTTKPTSVPKSPAPVAGLIAGLGVAALAFRGRK